MDDKVGGIYLHASKEATSGPSLDPTLETSPDDVDTAKSSIKNVSVATNAGNADDPSSDPELASFLALNGTEKDFTLDTAVNGVDLELFAETKDGPLDMLLNDKEQATKISECSSVIDDPLFESVGDKSPVTDRIASDLYLKVSASERAANVNGLDSVSINEKDSAVEDITPQDLEKEKVTAPVVDRPSEGVQDATLSNLAQQQKDSEDIHPNHESSDVANHTRDVTGAVIDTEEMSSTTQSEDAMETDSNAPLRSDLELQSEEVNTVSQSEDQPSDNETVKEVGEKGTESDLSSAVTTAPSSDPSKKNQPVYSSQFDPTSQRSMRQRQKIHNIVDRLRIGAHAESVPQVSPNATSNVQSVVSSVPVFAVASHYPANRLPNEGTKPPVYVTGDTSLIRQRPEFMDGSVKGQPQGHPMVKMATSKHGSLPGEPTGHGQIGARDAVNGAAFENSGQLVTRAPPDGNVRRAEFPQVMIQDVFSQSTGKRLTQRSVPAATHFPNSGSPMALSLHTPSGNNPVTVQQYVPAGAPVSGHQIHRPGSREDSQLGQLYSGSSGQSSSHQVQIEGSPVTQHHPKVNISHFERHGQVLPRQFPQWSYNPHHNPISNLQHFVNQPSQSHRMPQVVAAPPKQQQQTVVDLSTLQYGTSNSPVTLQTMPNKTVENEQNVPRYQLGNSSGGSTQGHTRGTGMPSPRFTTFNPNAAHYSRPLQQSRQQQLIHQGSLIPAQHLGIHEQTPAGVQVMEGSTNESLSNMPNIQLPVPLPNFGGFMAVKGGPDYPMFDSLSGYLVVPIKKLKDAASQTDVSCTDEDSSEFKLSYSTGRISVGVQAESETFFCSSCLMESEYDDLPPQKVADNVDLSCKECKKEFSSISKLQNHKSKVHNVRLPFRCGECAIRFEDHASVVKHLASHNDDMNCQTCGKVFQSKEMLERHQRLHNSPVNTCQFCCKAFKTFTAMQKHIEEVHWIGSGPGSSSVRLEVNNNVESQSSDEMNVDEFGPSQLKVTSRERNSISDKRSRLSSQDSNSEHAEHYCHFCQTQFFTDKDLLNHYLFYHRKGYGFQCPACPRFIHLWSRLKKHIKDHGLSVATNSSQDPGQMLGDPEAEEGSSRVDEEPPASRVSHGKASSPELLARGKNGFQAKMNSLIRKNADNRWECLKCRENFYSEVRVKNHLGTVHQERLYRCTICLLTFPHSTHLYWHMRDHKRKGDIGEIPPKFVSQTQSMEADLSESSQQHTFRCKHCPEVFYVEKHLKNHLGQRHGYKLFSCQICGDKFNFSSRLVMHMRYHSQKHKKKEKMTQQKSGMFSGITAASENEDSVDMEGTEESEVLDSDYDEEKQHESEAETDLSNLDDKQAAGFQSGFVYLCGFCNEGFSEETAFRKHMLGHQRTKKKCQICGHKVANQREADEHMASHHLESIDDTEVCDKIPDEVDDIDESNPDNLWTSAFVSEDSSSDKDGSTQVVNQGVVIDKVHLSSGKDENRRVACPICERQFQSKPGRRMHMKSTHRISGMRQYAKMKEQARLEPLSCPVCAKSFRSEGGTRLHLQNTHKMTWKQIHYILKGDDFEPKTACEGNGMGSTLPGSPPGLQKLIITKAKGQQSHIVTTGAESSNDIAGSPRSPSPLKSKLLASPGASRDDPSNLRSGADFQCPYCEQLSFFVKGIRSHITRLHPDSPNSGNLWALCEVCNRHYYDESYLAAHRATMHQMTEDFQCPGCTIVLPRLSGLYTHMKRKHPTMKWKVKDVWHRCGKCGRSFYHQRGLEAHQQLVHGTPTVLAPTPSPLTSADESTPGRGKTGAFHCPACDMMVTTIKGMQVHILKKHPKVQIRKWQNWVPCQECGEFLYDQARMEAHVQQIHTEGSGISKNKDLNTRQDILHSEPSNQTFSDSQQSLIEVGEGGGFQCPLCDEFYTKFMGVDAHLRQRHNILDRKRKPFWSLCLFCEQYYYDEESLKIHVDEYHGGEDATSNSKLGIDSDLSAADQSAIDAKTGVSQGGVSQVGFQCPKCEVVIPTIKGMQVHMYRGHQRLKRKRWQEWLSCDFCGVYLYDTKTLDRHVAFLHGKEATVSGVADKTTSSSTYSQDTNIEASKKRFDGIDNGFNCPTCPHICPKYAGIDTHMRVKHGYKAVRGKKFWHECHLCGLHLYNTFLLSEHMANVHGTTAVLDDSTINNSGIDGELPKSGDSGNRRVLPARLVNTSTPRADDEGVGEALKDPLQKVTESLSLESANTLSNTLSPSTSTPLTSSKGYECPFCLTVYTKFLGADAHIRQRHGTSKRKASAFWLTCETCDMKLYDQTCLQRHMTKHLQSNDLSLGVVEGIGEANTPEIVGNTSGIGRGEDHLVDMAIVRRGVFNCPCCELVTNYKGIGVHLAKRHAKSPRKPSQMWSPCSKCNNFYFTEDILKEHVNNSHGTPGDDDTAQGAQREDIDPHGDASQLPYVADEDIEGSIDPMPKDLESTNPGAITMSQVEPTIYRFAGRCYYYCPVCSRRSQLCRSINAHIWHQHKDLGTRGASLWKQCRICGSFFFDESYLETHIQEKHTAGEKATAETEAVDLEDASSVTEDGLDLSFDDGSLADQDEDDIEQEEEGLRQPSSVADTATGNPSVVNRSLRAGSGGAVARNVKVDFAENGENYGAGKRKADGEDRVENSKKIPKILNDGQQQ